MAGESVVSASNWLHLCSSDSLISFAAAEALRRDTAPDVLCAALCAAASQQEGESQQGESGKDANRLSVAALRLLKVVLRKERQGGESRLAQLVVESCCIATPSHSSEQALARASLAKALLHTPLPDATRLLLRAGLCPCLPSVLARLLPEAELACSRHAGLGLINALLEDASEDEGVDAACAASLAAHSSDLLLPPPVDADFTAPGSPFLPEVTARNFGGAGGALRRRALLATTRLAASPRSHAGPWVSFTAAMTQRGDDPFASSAMLVRHFVQEDDLLGFWLVATLTLTSHDAVAASLCESHRLFGLVIDSLGYDATALLDLLTSSLSFLRFILAALRLGAEQPAACRAAFGIACGGRAKEAFAVVHALHDTVRRLQAKRLMPFNAAPLLRRLADFPTLI